MSAFLTPTAAPSLPKLAKLAEETQRTIKQLAPCDPLPTERNGECTTVVHRVAGATLDELTRTANEHRCEIEVLQRRVAVHAFRAGEVLCAIQRMLKSNGAWCQWQRENNWNRGTVARYLKLFKAAKKEDRLHGMTIGEAEEKFCQRAKKTKKKSAAATHKAAPIAEVDDLSPTAQARESLAVALENLCLYRHGERMPNADELRDVKALATKLLDVIAELEAR